MAARKRKNFLEGGFDLPKLEEAVLSFWDEQRVFERSLKKNPPKRRFVFYEGPPYANGKPGIHHVLARVVKDVMLRYKTMRGYYVPRRAGWDTHGLPVEMAAEKALGIKSKRDIERMGVKAFNEVAKQQVWIHKDEWERLTRRIGYWLDLKNAYVTYAPEYIETIWWTMAQMWRKKLLYQGHRIVQWCPRCGTSLSSHELAQGYQNVTDRSVYVKFKLKKGQRISSFVADNDTYIVSWTTTPWTLPGNLALAIGENIPYVLLRTTKPDRASYVVAKDLASAVFKDSDFAVMGEFDGRRLIGLEYEPLFSVESLRSPLSYKIYPASFVTTTDGTGVVHTAVMYGEDDYQLGKKIGLPEHHTVDEEGRFTKDVPAGLAGKYVKAKETEDEIFAYLERRGNLLRIEPYAHEYPHCWRCGTPLLYYARTSWFIGMSKLRAELLKRNKRINWMPSHVKEGRFGEWLREVKDWNLSRERYWGVPLPVWTCTEAECGHREVPSGLDELSRLAGGAKNEYWVMRHGEAMGNVMHVLDSGSMNFSLTPRGKKEVAAAARVLRKANIDMIFTSPVTRAKETAEIVAAALGVKVLTDERLRELQVGPVFDGKPYTAYVEAFPTREERFDKRPEKGECLRDARTRVWDFLADMEKRYKGKKILIVSHGDPIIALIQSAAGWSEKELVERLGEKDFYPKTGKARKLDLRMVPRNDSGEADLHRPFVDEISIRCPKCGKKMKRTPEVADVWYDSGAMPLAQAHFPFELHGASRSGIGAKDLSLPKPEAHIAYPADYIAEGMDQTRGWFYTMLAIATALGYPEPYKNVITFGLINDKNGQKMSKSKGNIVEPFSVIDKYGVDAVRWYFYSGTPFGEPKNFDETEIAKVFRRLHLIIYNSYVFAETYAAPAAFGFRGAPKALKNVLDQWILARLTELLNTTTKQLDHYEIREASLEIERFVDDLSRWYIRRSRRRLQRPEDKKDYAAASATLAYVLGTLATLLAPFTPFFAEGLYHALGGKLDSIHLENWPKAVKRPANKRLIQAMAAARELAALGLAKRAEAGIKVRQPLASFTIGVKLPTEVQKILADEVNVKNILVSAKLKDGVVLDTKITPELRGEGLLREVARMVQELRQKAALEPKDKIALMLELPEAAKSAVKANEAALRNDVGAKLVEYARSEKFTAEQEGKLEEGPAWIGLRKI